MWMIKRVAIYIGSKNVQRCGNIPVESPGIIDIYQHDKSRKSITLGKNCTIYNDD